MRLRPEEISILHLLIEIFVLASKQRSVREVLLILLELDEEIRDIQMQ